MLEKMFHLKERGTNVKTELIAALTTAFSMLYIMALNPIIMSATGMPYGALVLGTAFASAIGCFLTGFLANLPFCQSIGLGLNSMFSYSLCVSMGMQWQHAAAIVFLSGIIFVAVMASPLRKKLSTALPMELRAAISAGIGLFICIIALFNSGIISADNNLLSLNSLTGGAPLLTLIGLIITSVLLLFKVPGAIFVGIILTTLIGIPMGVTIIPTSLFAEKASIAPVFLKLKFSGLFSYGVIPVLSAIVSFTLVDIWDTVGTLTAASGLANLYDDRGVLINNDKALLADSIATVAGSALFSQSTTTTFVESVNGVAAGGRTGLTSVFVGIIFLLASIFTPLFGIIPSAATAPALIIVGVMLMSNVTKIDWHNLEIAIPCFLTITFMPFSYSISNGIGIGMISYVLIKIIRGKFKEINPLMYILAALFILMFIL